MRMGGLDSTDAENHLTRILLLGGDCGGSTEPDFFTVETQGRRYCPYVFGRMTNTLEDEESA